MLGLAYFRICALVLFPGLLNCGVWLYCGLPKALNPFCSRWMQIIVSVHKPQVSVNFQLAIRRNTVKTPSSTLFRSE
jgi:hypothetical protein